MLESIARWLDRVIVAADYCSLWLARLGGLLILITVLMITLEVISRALLNQPLGASTELSGYVLAISSSWSFAYALLRKAHIRIDVLYLRLSGTARAVLDLLALALLGVFCVFVVGAVIGVAADSYSQSSLANTPLRTPLWIPQWLWAFGLIWFSLATALLLFRVLMALCMRDPASAQQVAGSPTVDEQIKTETEEPV
jgi:TRAP-type mannitol/chloroaromatic compound transport system permease small subunit